MGHWVQIRPVQLDALFVLLRLSLQISCKDAICPPPSGGGAGGKSPLPPNDSNGSLKESGLIHHSTGTGHHPQSHHQTLISFYSMPASKTQCSRREDKKALRKRVTFQDGCVMGPVGMSLKMCLFFSPLAGGEPGVRFRKLAGAPLASVCSLCSSPG